MTLGKSKIFLLFCLSFMVGVFLGRYVNQYAVALAAIVFIMLATLVWGRKWYMIVGFLGLILLLGTWRYQMSFPYDDENFIGQWYGQELELEGIIVREPDVRSNRVNLTIRPSQIVIPGLTRNLGIGSRLGGRDDSSVVGNVLLNIGRYPEYRYGDRLKISGKLEEPFVSEEFSYKDYLSRYDTYAVMRYPQIEKIGEGEGHPVKAVLLKIKAEFLEVMLGVLPEPHNALVGGLILGLKRSIPEDLRNAMIITGVSHIIVISGYNISLITRNLLHTRSVIGRRLAFWLSLLVVLAFVVLTGAEASVIRAAIMGMMLMFALNIGRIYNPANAVVLVGAVMVAENPKILNFDIGFQLSFLATLGLIYLAPVWEKWLSWLPNLLWFRTNLASTLAAQLFTLPLLIFYFDRISVVAPLVNILILWVVPYAMFFGFFTGLLGIIYLPLAKLLGGVLWVILEYQIQIVEYFSKLPLASTRATINILAIVIYYLLLVSGIWVYRHWKKFNYYLEYVEMKI